ncbi:MAG TPA: hypothetical protein VH502_01155 [Actinoplanes sp.]|jgi:hypothetical protein
MVLTGAVVITGNGHTRRGLLAAVAGASALAGCGVFDSGPDVPPAPDPLQPVLVEAVALAAAYDRLAAAQPPLARRLGPLAADHRAHAAELARVMGTAAPSAPASAAATIEDLRAAERAAQRTAGTACRQAPAERAALAGSIAACRASHVEALR